jgi:hypothetical protein
MALLKVELNAVMENKVHDPIKGHECALEKLVVVKGDAHTVGRPMTHDTMKVGHRGSICRKGMSGGNVMGHGRRSAIHGEECGDMKVGVEHQNEVRTVRACGPDGPRLWAGRSAHAQNRLGFRVLCYVC